MANNSEIFNFTIDSTLVAQLTHPGDSSVKTYYSENLKGDGYYGRSDGFHSVQYNLTGVIGNIAIQATLATIPTEEDWFTVTTSLHQASESNNNRSGSFIYNFTGNYVWLRVSVTDYTDGSVRSVVLNH